MLACSSSISLDLYVSSAFFFFASDYRHIAEVPTAYHAKSSIFASLPKCPYVTDSREGKPDAKLALQVFEVQ
jgi:hypothetical protein